MTEQSRKGNKQGLHAKSPQKDIPSKPSPPPINPNLDTDKCDKHNRESDTIKKPSRRLRITDLIMVVATCVIAYATVTYTGYAGKQWETMTEQTKVAYQQLSTAKGSIRIANDALKDARESSKEQSDRAERSTKVNEKIAQASKQSVDTAKQIAKKSLDATIDNFHLEQRAWVGLTNISPPGYTEGDKKVYLKDGQKITGSVIITNSGKTPARNVRAIIGINYLKSEDKFSPDYRNVVTKGGPTITIIQPGASQVAWFPPFPVEGVFSKTDIDNVSKGKRIVYAFGRITYEDVFEKQHVTNFCMFLSPDLTTLNDCSTNNEAD